MSTTSVSEPSSPPKASDLKLKTYFLRSRPGSVQSESGLFDVRAARSRTRKNPRNPGRAVILRARLRFGMKDRKKRIPCVFRTWLFGSDTSEKTVRSGMRLQFRTVHVSFGGRSSRVSCWFLFVKITSKNGFASFGRKKKDFLGAFDGS